MTAHRLAILACSCIAASGLLAAGVRAPTAQEQPQTPAQARIAAAEGATAKNPRDVEALTQLALALAARARETADTTFYTRADKTLDAALRLDGDNFEALKARAWVLLGRHEFPAALQLATRLNKRAPDDLQVYGFLTDAHAELGNYKEAEESCQWMLDLRPGNIPAFTRAAYLRELFGDLDGALELMTKSYERTPPHETEERAWLLTQIGHLLFLSQRNADAAQALRDALGIFPDYHYALGALAKVVAAEGRHDEAVGLLKRRYEIAPHPENLYDLGKALAASGDKTGAGKAFKQFELEATRESASWDNANRELIFYLVDIAARPAEALKLATMEAARRQDVYTLDAYAWALQANGRVREAHEQVRRARAVGIKDPAFLARAQVIDKLNSR
jgi:tetratricopeptide (TPR) repeat protein